MQRLERGIAKLPTHIADVAQRAAVDVLQAQQQRADAGACAFGIGVAALALSLIQSALRLGT